MRNLDLMCALALLAKEPSVKTPNVKYKKKVLSVNDPEYKRQRNRAKAERKRNK